MDRIMKGLIVILIIAFLCGCGKSDGSGNATNSPPQIDVGPDPADDEPSPGDPVDDGSAVDGTDTVDDVPQDDAADDGADDTVLPEDDTADDSANVTLPPVSVQPSDAEDYIIIKIENFKFIPKEVTIRPGMTVVWWNNDYYKDAIRKHKIAPRRNYNETRGWMSPILMQGDRYNYTFMQKGEFTYMDPVFVKSYEQEGKIVVK